MRVVFLMNGYGYERGDEAEVDEATANELVSDGLVRPTGPQPVAIEEEPEVEAEEAEISEEAAGAE